MALEHPEVRGEQTLEISHLLQLVLPRDIESGERLVKLLDERREMLRLGPKILSGVDPRVCAESDQDTSDYDRQLPGKTCPYRHRLSHTKLPRLLSDPTILEFSCRTTMPTRSGSRKASTAGPTKPTRTGAIPC